MPSREKSEKILGYSRWIVLIAAFLGMSLVSPYQYAWSSVSPLIAKANDWPLNQISIIFTFFVLFQSGASFPAGVLRDRYGPRILTMVGGALAALGIFSLTFGSFSILSVLYGILGSFGAGIVYNCAVSTGNKWFPDKRGLTTGLIAGAFSWGSIPFILWIRTAADVSNFSTILYEIALIVGAVIIISGYFMKDPPKDWKPPNESSTQEDTHQRPSKHQFTLKETVKTWQFWILYISLFLISGAGLMTISKIVSYAESLGFVSVVGTMAAIGLTVTSGLGRPIIGKISDKMGQEKTMTMSFILTGVFTLVVSITSSAAVFITGTLIALFFWGSLFTLFPAITGHYYGENYAASNYGLLYTAKMGGGLYGGYISAKIMTSFGFRTTFVFGGSLAIAAASLILLLKYKPPTWKEKGK